MPANTQAFTNMHNDPWGVCRSRSSRPTTTGNRNIPVDENIRPLKKLRLVITTNSEIAFHINCRRAVELHVMPPPTADKGQITTDVQHRLSMEIQLTTFAHRQIVLRVYFCTSVEVPGARIKGPVVPDPKLYVRKRRR